MFIRCIDIHDNGLGVGRVLQCWGILYFVFCSFLLSEIEKWKLNFTSVIELNEYLFILSERDTFMNEKRITH